MRHVAAVAIVVALSVASCSTSDNTAGEIGPATIATSTAGSIPAPTSPTTAPRTTAPPTTTSTSPPVDVQNWITVDGNGWSDRRTESAFVPRGVNLLRKVQPVGDQLFGSYDSVWVGEQLNGIAANGFNTVRFLLDLCMDCTATADGIRPRYLDQLTNLLEQMEARGLVALPTSNDVPDPGYSERLPCCEPFGGYRNSLYLSPEGHEIAAEYFTDLIEGLQARGAPLHIVMGWELANEQFFLRDVPPISLTSGTVTAADGATYDLADDDAVTEMVERNLVGYIDHVGAAIRAVDEGALVTIGFFSAEDPTADRTARDKRWVVPEIAMRQADLDFIDLHAYPGLGGTWEAIGPAFGLDEPPTIPLLLGEFGAFQSANPDRAEAATAMVSWQTESCDWGFGGWLVWLWGEKTDDEVITANSGDGEIARALSPSVRPDPCEPGSYVSANLALGRPVTASREESDEYGAARVNDGSIETWWSAADGAPQWVEIDLESEKPIGWVDIEIGHVTPPGLQTHRVYVRAEGEEAPGRLIGDATGSVVDGDVLSLAVPTDVGPVRYVRLETVDIDGWVIIHDVAAFGP